MAPPLADLTAQAQTLTSAGDLAGARAVLADGLRGADADPRRATDDLAVAAALHARVLIALGDPQSARLWAAYAHQAEERLHGPRDERTVAAAATHAAVLQRIGQHGRAALVYHDLLAEMTRLDGGDSPRVLAAEADLAIAEHSAGHCGAARARLANAWRRHRTAYGDEAPAGIKMLARLGAMERECGRDAAAREHLALANDLSARHLPPGHPLARQAARLAAAERTGRHTCGKMRRPAPTADDDTEIRVGAFRPFPRRPTVPDPASVDPWDTAELDDPAQPPPDDRETDPAGTVYQQPLYLRDVHRSPGDVTGRHARADTPPPLPGQRAPDYGEDGRPLPKGTARPEPEARPRSRGRTVMLAAALAAGVAATTAAVILTLPDANGAVTPAAAPTTATTTTTTPLGAPDGVRIVRDTGDSVTLQWMYPATGTGQVVISGARSGEPAAEFQKLPAGTTDFVVYSLDTGENYCFSIGVRQSKNRIAGAAPVCTRR
ncbi:fibronectin type III domain-containing protein [Actinoplanes sp. NPDC051851]|uniref:fibronectin type III domain-containing protein n=1 Tax=Actinoplanes sp. NPDC051851 TaxID=3154753 RepID=UPI00342F4CE8